MTGCALSSAGPPAPVPEPIVAPAVAGRDAQALPEPTSLAPPATEVVEPADLVEVEPSPPPTWEWALSVVPELASHSEESLSSTAYARFSRWFRDGARKIYLRQGDECLEVRGSVERGFTYRQTVTTEGNTRTRSGYDLEIGEGGITESGPGGITYQRDARGRWEEVGGFGTGCFSILIPESMSKVKDGVAYFEGYGYTLTAACSQQISEIQACEDGSSRTCTRCGGVRLQPHATSRAWGSASMTASGSRGGPPPVHDCTQPCPADEWTPRLEGLDRVLKGRRFHARGGAEDGVLFLRAEDCRRVARRIRKQQQAG